MTTDFLQSLSVIERQVGEYYQQQRFKDWFRPQNLRDSVYAYLERPGKRLRPAVLMWASGAVGGNPELALPAAAAVEMFHTWTLVHDDVIDDDDLRRGGPTVHELSRQYAVEHMGYGDAKSREYGRNIAILAGDCQQGWAVTLLCEVAKQGGADASVVVDVISELESRVVNTLIEGETLDVQYAQMTVGQLSSDDIVRMLWMKTGVLYEFAARSGAKLGLNVSDNDHPLVAALSRFAGCCGTAFQLQDDILGLMGDEQTLGKPIGSDVREGKKTTIVYYALTSANESDRKFLLSVLGNRDATPDEVAKATQMMVALGGVDKTIELARHHIDKAIPELSILPESNYRDLLTSWADFMVNRSF